MRRILYSLGAICVLAGASLILPAVASALPVNNCTGSGTNWSIDEALFPLGIESASCLIPNLGFNGGPIRYDLLESPGVVSDYVDFASNGPGLGTLVNLISDPNPGITGPRAGATAILESGPDGNQSTSLGLVGGAFHFTVNDTSEDTDPPAVPEPPTGLLMASAGMLPLALTYLGRRGKAKGQPTVA